MYVMVSLTIKKGFHISAWWSRYNEVKALCVAKPGIRIYIYIYIYIVTVKVVVQVRLWMILAGVLGSLTLMVAIQSPRLALDT